MSLIDIKSCDQVLNYLIHCFYKGSSKFSLEPADVKLMSWEKQKQFLDATVLSKNFQSYPVNVNFTQKFFKNLIKALESEQDIHDDIYTYLCSIMEDMNNGNDFSHRHYVIENDLNNVVIIKETNNIVVNGTTGLRTWEASKMLADWALCNKSIFKNKTVMELGSGVGFTGIALAKLCNVQSFLFTDCHSDVLKTICENIRINFPHLLQETNNRNTVFKSENKHLEVMELDWNYIEESPVNIKPDVLIGADIIYDPQIITPLCQVINTYFKRNNLLEVYIANVVRIENTLKIFLDTLDSMDLIYETVTLSNNGFIQWDENIQQCFYKIKLK